MSFSIVTGNGFQTNAQRADNDGTFGKTYGVAAFYNTGYTLLNNFKYNLSFKYRAPSGITYYATPSEWRDWGSGSPDNIYDTPFYYNTYPSNTGNCILVSDVFYCTPSNSYYETTEKMDLIFPKHLGFSAGNDPGYWIEIDEVNLYHVYPPSSPMCSTLSINNFTTTGFTLNGYVNPYGLATNAYFHVDLYSPNSSSNYQCDENPMSGHLTNFSVSKTISYITGQTINVTMYATNSAGGYTGNTINTYAPSLPSFTINTHSTDSPINFNVTGITIRADIINYWLPTTYTFEWGTSTGVYTQTTPVTSSTYGGTWNNATLSGYTIDNIGVNLTGLTNSNIYYYRLKCTNGLGTKYSSEYTFRTIPVGYYWPDQGGLFISPLIGSNYSHTQGVIMAMSDISTGTTWGCNGTFIDTYGHYNIGEGSGNTIAIVNGCATLGIAAELCYNLSMSGFTDWWLPSTYELLYASSYTSLLGIPDSISYWSSTESNTPSNNAYIIYYSTGGSYQVGTPKTSSCRVRPIRYF